MLCAGCKADELKHLPQACGQPALLCDSVERECVVQLMPLEVIAEGVPAQNSMLTWLFEAPSAKRTMSVEIWPQQSPESVMSSTEGVLTEPVEQKQIAWGAPEERFVFDSVEDGSRSWLAFNVLTTTILKFRFITRDPMHVGKQGAKRLIAEAALRIDEDIEAVVGPSGAISVCLVSGSRVCGIAAFAVQLECKGGTRPAWKGEVEYVTDGALNAPKDVDEHSSGSARVPSKSPSGFRPPSPAFRLQSPRHSPNSGRRMAQPESPHSRVRGGLLRPELEPELHVPAPSAPPAPLAPPAPVPAAELGPPIVPGMAFLPPSAKRNASSEFEGPLPPVPWEPIPSPVTLPASKEEKTERKKGPVEGHPGGVIARKVS